MSLCTVIKKPQTFLDHAKQIALVLLTVFIIRTFFFGLYSVPSGSMETTMLVGDCFVADKCTYLFSSAQRGDIISFNSPLFEYSQSTIVRLFQEYVWGPINVTKRVIALPGDEIEGRVEEGKPVIYLNGKKLNEPYRNRYPLLAVYSSNPEKLVAAAKEEVNALVSQGTMTEAHVEEYISKKLASSIHYKSYDPAFTLTNQPFYHIEEAFISKGVNGKPYVINPDTLINTPKHGNQPPNDRNYYDGSDVFHIVLEPNHYWVMGDNRLNSYDSRMFGPLNGRLIHGRIVFRLASVDISSSGFIGDLLKNPLAFVRHIRWNRFLQWMY